MTEPRDELLERYAEAAAQDPRRPSERVRHAARAHAQMLRDQASEAKRAEGSAPTRPAANHPRWTLSLVASLAVVGLAGLLYVQIDQGEPQDREIALGAPSPSAIPAPTSPTAPPALSAPPAQNAAPALAKAAPPRVYSTVPTEAAPHTAKQTHTAGEQIASADAAVRETTNEARAESAVRAATAQMRAPATPAATAPAKLAAAPAAVAAAPAMADISRSRQAMVVDTAAAQLLQAARGGQVETVQKLLAQGVAINTRDDKGNTALILAVTYRQPNVVRILLDRGADPALVNNEGMTALRLASQMEMPEMVQLLQTPR
jgi:hypothetical protein